MEQILPYPGYRLLLIQTDVIVYNFIWIPNLRQFIIHLMIYFISTKYPGFNLDTSTLDTRKKILKRCCQFFLR
jgi:hypothetical protein